MEHTFAVQGWRSTTARHACRSAGPYRIETPFAVSTYVKASSAAASQEAARTLEDRLEFAMVGLGVKTPSLYGTSKTDPIALQISERVHRRGRVPGNSGEKVGEALALICEAYAPILLSDGFPRVWPELLKEMEARNLATGGEVATRPLVRLVRVAAALRSRDHSLRTRDLVRRAVARLGDERMGVTSTQTLIFGVRATEGPTAKGTAA